MNILKLASITLVILLVIIYLIFDYIIQDFYIAIILTLLCLAIFARFVITIIVFPGSFSLYYQLTLANISNFFAKRALQNISIISNTINNHIYPNSIIQSALFFFHQQYQVFSQMNPKTNLQSTYFNHLRDLQEILQYDPTNWQIAVEKLRNENKTQVKPCAKGLLEFLENHVLMRQKNANTLSQLMALEFLGTLQERRIQILLSTPEAQRLSIKNSKISIDCINIIYSPNAPTVLFCNPNAGYYEYMYFDCDWFKFYRKLNYNVIMWNYRSFGASTGSVNPKNCIEDGELIVDYFRKRFNFPIFGIHGQSLGGMVATEVAYSKKMSFLITDRTFSSLGQTASAWLGTPARFALNCLRIGWDKPNHLSYYNFNGPKLLIQDTLDEVIPYTSQMQTSIVRCHFIDSKTPSCFSQFFDLESTQYMRFFQTKIIDTATLTEFGNSLQKLMNFFEKIQNIENQEEQKLNTKYIELLNDDNLDLIKHSVQEIQEIFSLLNYNGNCLFRVLSGNATVSLETVALFFGSCFTFGQQNGEFMRNHVQFEKEIDFLCLNDKPFQQWTWMKKEILMSVAIIRQIVGKFNSFLQDQNECSLEMTGYTNDSDINQSKAEKLGYLVAIACGHNNNLSKEENMKVAYFFESQKLIIQ